MRNLDLELAARPAVRPVRATVPNVRWTPRVELALAVTVLAVLLATAIALGYGGVAAVAGIGVGLVGVTKGRDGILACALVALGSLPYLALVLLLGVGA